MRRLTILTILLLLYTGALTTFADGVRVAFTPTPGAVPISGRTIVTDSNEKEVINTVAGLFRNDYMLVTGKELKISDRTVKGNLIIIGTPASSHIRKLVSKGLIDLSPIEHGYEQYMITTVTNAFSNNTDAIVIVGSDPRGAAYGTLSLSERMGVSPWYWWADVPVARHDEVYVSGHEVSAPPTVRYRGVFVNDEDWGLLPWAAKTYEPEVGNIGPRTYARICELLLRLRGNMLAPAMHDCSDPFYSHPDNKVMADRYGIMITTSHCEPLLFNNASPSEWDSSRDGEWDYRTNRQTIYNKLDARVAEAARYDNIYTMAMRGLHDEGMRGNYTLEEKVTTLHDAIMDQRKILAGHIATPVEEIPQIFIPYKEAQTLYEAGLEVPDDITLVWPDDNYGFLKLLSSPRERQRSGRAGVYYHLSYLGVPHSYLWLNTTPPMLMYEELKKAYDTGADRYWLLNVGDIKPMELGVQLFFDMAWDFKSFSYDNVNRRQAEFMCSIFGEKYRSDFQNLLDEYYRLSWIRKPEAMGWDREWDSPYYSQIRDTDFSFANYNDAQRRLADYTRLADNAERIMLSLPERLQPVFFEMAGYAALASNQMNRKFLLAQLNHELTAAGDYEGANGAAAQCVAANDSINALNGIYNSMLDGKWAHMMSIPPAYCAFNHLMPELTIHEGHDAKVIDISPAPEKDILDGCMVIPVDSYTSVTGNGRHDVRVLEGLGYDWQVLQLGEVTQAPQDVTSPDTPRVNYTLPAIAADSVKVIVYTVPRFPLYQGATTYFGVTVDDAPVQTSCYLPVEWSQEWKDNTIRNGMLTEMTFPVSSTADSHTLSIVSGDPGLLVQRIIVDWGGLRPSYLGPSVKK